MIATKIAPPRLLLSVDEAAQSLGVGRDLVYKLLKLGALQSIKVGRYRKIPLRALEQFIERQSHEETRTP